MSANSSTEPGATVAKPLKRRWWALLYVPAWVVLSFEAAQAVTYVVVQLLVALHVPLASVNEAVLQTLLSVLIYAVSLVIAIGIPLKLRKIRTTRKDLGFNRLPNWMDIVLAPAAFVVYALISAILLWVISQLLPTVNWNQAQQVGFTSLHMRYEYILAFVTLVVLAPIAEETLFRGYLFGKLKKKVPVWLTILVTSLVFGALHLGIGTTTSLQWNVALDTFSLSIVLCSLRLVTGNIWAGVLLHMIKNGIAYYVLFVDQSLLRIMGG